jgi:hypothetical protein
LAGSKCDAGATCARDLDEQKRRMVHPGRS